MASQVRSCAFGGGEVVRVGPDHRDPFHPHIRAEAVLAASRSTPLLHAGSTVPHRARQHRCKTVAAPDATPIGDPRGGVDVDCTVDNAYDASHVIIAMESAVEVLAVHTPSAVLAT